MTLKRSEMGFFEFRIFLIWCNVARAFPIFGVLKSPALFQEKELQVSCFNVIDLFADTAAILISIVSKDIMGCSGRKLKYISPLGIP